MLGARRIRSQVAMSVLGVLAVAASQAAGQTVTVANPATSLMPEDFGPFVFAPKVLLAGTSALDPRPRWEIDGSSGDAFLTVDARGITRVAARKVTPRTNYDSQVVSIDLDGRIVDVQPNLVSVLRDPDEEQVDDPFFPELAQLISETYHPLVRDHQGGTCRLGLFGGTPFEDEDPWRFQGERATRLNSRQELAEHFNFDVFNLMPWSVPGLKQGIRHTNGAWAFPFFASGPSIHGLVMNLEVPVGSQAEDGRRTTLIRNGDRAYDGNAWMELNLGNWEYAGSFATGHWRFAASGRATFSSDGYRYALPSRPANAPLVRAHWISSPTGELSIIARQLATGELPNPSIPSNVFRSLSAPWTALNHDGDVVFTSESGPAREPVSRSGVFLYRQGQVQRILSPGDSIAYGPGQTPGAVLTIASLRPYGRPQISNRGDVLAAVRVGNRASTDVCLRLAAPDRQSGLAGWIRVAGAGDRILNAPGWRVHSIREDSTTQGFSLCASLNNQGQVLLLATIERNVPGQSQPVQTGAYLGFDLQRGLHLLWADRQVIPDANSGALNAYRMVTIFEAFPSNVGWNGTNSGCAGHFNDFGALAIYAMVHRVDQAPGLGANAALLFKVQQAANRGDLGSFEYPLVADGVIDNNDVVAFTQLFFDDSRRADLNDDGVLDGRDVQRMVEFLSEAGR